MFRLTRVSLCVALLSGTMLTGCSGGVSPVAVAPSAAHPMRIQTTEYKANDWVDQIGNSNRAYLDSCYPVWARQIGNFNRVSADGTNRSLHASQIGNFNSIRSE